jgi:hypothetical protein
MADQVFGERDFYYIVHQGGSNDRTWKTLGVFPDE